MSVTSIGDLRQFLFTTRNTTELKSDLGTLVQELGTGQVADLTSHLGASQTSLASFDRQLAMLSRFSDANSDTARSLATMQTVLGDVDLRRAQTSDALIVVDASSSPAQRKNASELAESNFISSVSALNTRYGGKALFSGTAVETTPLADPVEMLDSIRTAISGLGSTIDVKNAISDWFDSPTGGFATSGYLGDATGVQVRAVNTNETVEIAGRADDGAIRDTLKALALGALSEDGSVSLSNSDRGKLQRQAGEDLLGAAASMASFQSRLGFAEGKVENASVLISSQQTSLGIGRNEMVNADPFETASRLQAIQIQLETQYTLTARLSRLSLTEYLR